MKKHSLSLLILSGLVWAGAMLAGCASPDYRIKQNPELFATFSPEVQEKVRKGEVDIGFSTEAVTMALGTPRRIYTRQTKEGQYEVWSYTSSYSTTDRQRVQADVRYRDITGRTRTTTEWVWVDVPRETEYETIRVEFSGGKVSAVETMTR